jgi:hypothetical protein
VRKLRVKAEDKTVVCDGNAPLKACSCISEAVVDTVSINLHVHNLFVLRARRASLLATGISLAFRTPILSYSLLRFDLLHGLDLLKTVWIE